MVFVRDMNIVEEIYKGIVEVCLKLDDQIVKLVFCNINEIIEFYIGFLVNFKEVVLNVYVFKGGCFLVVVLIFGLMNIDSGNEMNDVKDCVILIGLVF